MHKVNERSRLVVTLNLLSNRQAVIPVSLRYRIDCETTGREVLGWTDVTPAAALVVNVPALLNSIIAPTNAFEVKKITAEANYDTPEAFVAAERWKVQNLLGVN